MQYIRCSGEWLQRDQVGIRQQLDHPAFFISCLLYGILHIPTLLSSSVPFSCFIVAFPLRVGVGVTRVSNTCACRSRAHATRVLILLAYFHSFFNSNCCYIYCFCYKSALCGAFSIMAISVLFILLFLCVSVMLLVYVHFLYYFEANTNLLCCMNSTYFFSQYWVCCVST